MVTKDAIIEVLKTVEDPELFIDIWFLGLIYNIDISDMDESPESKPDEKMIQIEMTFTSPMCPAGPQLVQEIHDKVTAIDGVAKVEVQVVFVPPWKAPDDVKEMLGLP